MWIYIMGLMLIFEQYDMQLNQTVQQLRRQTCSRREVNFQNERQMHMISQFNQQVNSSGKFTMNHCFKIPYASFHFFKNIKFCAF